MAVYLVDFENVSSAGISGIQKLTKEDKVYIFYTVNASNMSFAAHLNLLSSPAEVVYYNVASGGKNALDFQLASFLGYLICQGKEKKFCIISNDRGFEYVKAFWERNGVAADISIFGAPSINRSLLAAEKPFAARIQQNAQTSALPSGISPEQLEQMKAETDKYTEQKKAAEAAAKEAYEGNTAENTERSQIKPANEEKDTVKKENDAGTMETAEEKPVKRRGRPKKQVTEKPAKNEEIPANAAGNTAKPAAEKAKANSAKGKNSAKKENDLDALKNALRPLLAKAKLNSEDEVANVANYFKLADGKQQFYRNLITLYGMERGVEIYRVIRTEYTNLTKLVKQ